jgi:hypothetical protein
VTNTLSHWNNPPDHQLQLGTLPQQTYHTSNNNHKECHNQSTGATIRKTNAQAGYQKPSSQSKIALTETRNSLRAAIVRTNRLESKKNITKNQQ